MTNDFNIQRIAQIPEYINFNRYMNIFEKHVIRFFDKVV